MLFLRRLDVCILQIATFLAVVRAGSLGFARRASPADDSCDIHHARRALIDLSATGVSFCTAFLHTRQGATKTVSTATTSTETCLIRTVTTTVHGTLTTYTYTGTTTFPQLTQFQYSSTIFVPTGTVRPLNKRGPASPAIITPAPLATCASSILSPACSSLLAPTTTTHISTSTHSEHSCLTTTTSTFTTTRHTITESFEFTVTPPPVLLSATGVLTTTVPADCLVTPYALPTGYPVEDFVEFPQYPYQPQDAVSCCVACSVRENCIASAFIVTDGPGGSCELLIRDSDGSGVGVSAICPLGLQDYDFSTPDPEGDILPGPCGY